MNFEDEAYVRIYQRDTKTWLRWQWEGQTVFCLLSRKLDRAGVIDDITDPVADVALVTRLPEAVVAIGLPRLLESGTFELHGTKLIAPRYVEAQNATKSDRLRAAELRKRRRDLARAGSPSRPPPADSSVRDDAVTAERDSAHLVTEGEQDVMPPSQSVAPSSREVTSSHAASHGVTPSLAYPSLALSDPPEPPRGQTDDDGDTKTTSTSRRRPGKRGSTECPLDLKPDPTTAATAWELGFSEKLRDFEVKRCIDWARGKTVKRGDWQATLRNWLRKSAEERGLKPREEPDDQQRLWQERRRAATAIPTDAVKPPPGFREKMGGIFAG